MTALAADLIARIARTGPMTVAAFMTECLMHPIHGYYTTRTPFGTQGDFITSPDISQMFGELLGLCIAQCWLDQGAPKTFSLAELGPGRGTLMADALRATRNVPGFHDAANVHFIETSPKLRLMQAEQVPTATWHDTVDTLPDVPLFVIANEFFDALPIRQFVRDGDGWRERVIGVNDGQLTFGLSDRSQPSYLDHRRGDTQDDDLVEYCPPLEGIVQAISQKIAQQGGCGLIVDYGDWQSLGDTLQAVKGHKTAHIFDAPGQVDLTAHVDFADIARHVTDAKFTRLTTQGVFLERLGITSRAQAIAQNLSGDSLERHISAHRRLTHPSEMGELFKVIGIYPATATTPPGLQP